MVKPKVQGLYYMLLEGGRRIKMILAEICIGFVKSCHFLVTSHVSFLVYS